MRNPYIKPSITCVKIKSETLLASQSVRMSGESQANDVALSKEWFFFDEMEPTEADADDSDDWEDFDWEEEEEGMY